MEFIPQTLSGMLRNMECRHKRLKIKDVLIFSKQIIEALSYLDVTLP